MPRAVLDPNVLVSALITPRGASAGLISELRAGGFELVTSRGLLSELERVLMREKFRRYVTVEEVGAYVRLVRQEGEVVDDPPTAAGASEDPGDDYLIALAGAAGAHVLVSGDRHLLSLGDRFPVLSPREFLDSLAGS